jgi:hypothetical protein
VRTRTVVGASLAGLLLTAQLNAAAPTTCAVDDPCKASARANEISVVFLGDSGFGEGGASEWGSHAQADIAARIDGICPRPDLVFFLGDNVYWKGSPDLFGPRFDTVYRNLFDAEGRRVHAALGNHDVKGCRIATFGGFVQKETCLDALHRAVHEDAKQGAAATGEHAQATWLNEDVREHATTVSPLDCPSAFDAAYEQAPDVGNECFATEALRHSAFGYQVRGGSPLRYYSIDWPAPAAFDAPATEAPRLRVLVADSNTLDVFGGRIPAAAGADKPRADRLQLLWMENQLRTAPGDAWTIMAMHHPPFTPNGCAFKLLGRCVGGHGDEEGLQKQLTSVFGLGGEGARAPDLMMTAHNHFYARTHALDASGYPAPAGTSAVRYFVTGGGGAPLYRMLPLHARWAKGGAFYHFVYLRLQKETAFFWTIDDRGRVRDSGCFKKGDTIDGTVDADYKAAQLVCGPPALSR